MFLHFIAMTQPQQGGGGMGIMGFLPWILIIVVFYLLLIRPQARRQKRHQEMLKAVKKGDRVVTSGGIHGLVVGVKENILVVRIADKVKVELDRGSVSRVVPSEVEESSEKD